MERRLGTQINCTILCGVFLEQQIGPSDCNALGNSYVALENHNIQNLVEVDQTLFVMRFV
jgi:hypothetical protein